MSKKFQVNRENFSIHAMLQKSNNKKFKRTFSNKSGFTMIELLLVSVMMIIIGGISVPVYQSFQVKNDVDGVAGQIEQSVLRAQLLSQASEGDSNWGVSVQAGSVVLFKGLNYATRDSSYDEIFSIPPTITPSGFTEVVFSKIFGMPQSSGTLTLTSSTNITKSLVISNKGVVEY